MYDRANIPLACNIQNKAWLKVLTKISTKFGAEFINLLQKNMTVVKLWEEHVKKSSAELVVLTLERVFAHFFFLFKKGYNVPGTSPL